MVARWRGGGTSEQKGREGEMNVSSFPLIIYFVNINFFQKSVVIIGIDIIIRDRQYLHEVLSLGIKEGCISCSWRAFPAGTYKHEPKKNQQKVREKESIHTIRNTCSFSSTKHSISTGLEPSCSKNSFILAGSSSAE